MPDGGNIGFDWHIDEFGGKPNKNDNRPILICLMGLSGGNQAFYGTNFMKTASKNGFKPVVFIYRGTTNNYITFIILCKLLERL